MEIVGLARKILHTCGRKYVLINCNLFLVSTFFHGLPCARVKLDYGILDIAPLLRANP